MPYAFAIDSPPGHNITGFPHFHVSPSFGGLCRMCRGQPETRQDRNRCKAEFSAHDIRHVENMPGRHREISAHRERQICGDQFYFEWTRWAWRTSNNYFTSAIKTSKAAIFRFLGLRSALERTALENRTFRLRSFSS